MTNQQQSTYQRLRRNSIAGTTAFVATEVDSFANSIDRFLGGKVPEASFLEHRLRHGVYGQRQDGVHMIRSKLPLGLLGPEQLEAFADLTEAYSSGIAHLTTRQDIQVHFVPLTQTPDLMRVLADAEMTSREACGNVVRNITASELAGVEQGEAFDVTPYGMALATFLLRHPDGQSLGRKFKVTLSGTFDPRFNNGPIHDLGLTARVQDGERGFHVLVGGGLGAVPHEAQVLTEFLPQEELFPTTVAILRLFARHGEKKRRARARMKFLVAEWGIERFREEVAKERATLEPQPEWANFCDTTQDWTDQPLFAAGSALPEPRDDAEAKWLRTNVFEQKQAGYATVKVRVPRGDLSPDQLRGLATLLRAHVGDSLRLGVDQSIFLRFVSWDRLAMVYDGLKSLQLSQPGAGGLGDTVTCPGADSCKLGITTPRSLHRHIESLLDDLSDEPRLEQLRIKVSGCPSSCAQHQLADIGFFGAARTQNGITSPHFMLVLGGQYGGWGDQGIGSGFGIPIAKIPAVRIGEAIDQLTSFYLEESSPEESWGAFVRRQGRSELKKLLKEVTNLPSFDEAPELYREYGADQTFTMVRGIGECAGAVVLGSDLLLIQADQSADLALELFEKGAEPDKIQDAALDAMKYAAQALLSTQQRSVDSLQDTANAFRTDFYDTGLIFEGVGHYFLSAVDETTQEVSGDRVRRLAVEAGLFVEEAHSIVAKLQNPRLMS